MGKVILKNVTKRYISNVPPAVNNFNIEIDDGEFLVLVGPSGCGKSTVLRMVAGLERITEGEIYISDKLVNSLPPKSRDLAMVFQNYALYPTMNVYENTAFSLRIRKYLKSTIESKVKEATRILDIENYTDRFPRQLSGGQKQRVALGRAIVRNPGVFLMDEPLSNIDAKMRIQMRVELMRLHHRLKTTTIYVTHDQTEAITMGNRIVVMNEGKIQQAGTPREIYNKPSSVFVGSFIGSPPMEFVKGRLVMRDNALYFISGRILLKIPDEKSQQLINGNYDANDLILGIRPENMSEDALQMKENTQCSFKAKVRFVEFHGSDQYVIVEADKNCELRVRVNSRSSFTGEESASFHVDMDSVVFFDNNTKKRIL